MNIRSIKPKRKMKNNLLVALALLATLSACSEDESMDCVQPAGATSVYLSDATRTWIPENYATLDAPIVFESENGDELQFETLSKSEDLLGVHEVLVPCQNDPEDSLVVEASSERIYYEISASNDYHFTVIADVVIEDMTYFDKLTIGVFKTDVLGGNTFFGQIANLVTDARTTPNAQSQVNGKFFFFEEVSIAGKLFSDVYAAEFESNEVGGNIYYNQSQGLVGFIDDEGVAWALKE